MPLSSTSQPTSNHKELTTPQLSAPSSAFTEPPGNPSQLPTMLGEGCWGTVCLAVVLSEPPASQCLWTDRGPHLVGETEQPPGRGIFPRGLKDVVDQGKLSPSASRSWGRCSPGGLDFAGAPVGLVTRCVARQVQLPDALQDGVPVESALWH